MAASLRSFKRQQQTQPSSRLMVLPAEIRLIILTDLLKYHFYIDPQRSLGSSDDEYKTVTQRSAQILRTCQQLYNEGHEILYGDNSLGIDFIVFQSIIFCNILDFQFYIPALVHGVEQDEFYLLEHAECHRYRPGILSITDASRLINTYQALDKFRHIRVSTEYKNQQHIFLICQFLRNLLFDKNVTFAMKYIGPDEHSDPVSEDFNELRFELAALQSTKILRCQSFHFEEDCLACEVWYPHLRIEEIIQSTKPPGDVFQIWRHFMKDCILKLPKVQDVVFENFYMAEMDDLRQHMLDYEDGKFRRKQRHIMNLAVKWNKRWAEIETANLKARLQAVNLYQTQTNKILNSALETGNAEPMIREMGFKNLRGR